MAGVRSLVYWFIDISTYKSFAAENENKIGHYTFVGSHLG